MKKPCHSATLCTTNISWTGHASNPGLHVVSAVVMARPACLLPMIEVTQKADLGENVALT